MLESKAESTPSAYQKLLDELPRTGPGTRGGEMLRRYWHPVCLSANLKDIPIAVRMLGEDLVVFRDGKGRPGLLGIHCQHRLASLEYGQVMEDGLMCSYHGWRYDTQGRCIDTPLEPRNSDLKDKIRHLWYPVEEWGGVIWTYMGPEKENPPPLPKIDVLARRDGEVKLVGGDVRNYSYLNWMENFADMGHAVVLHGLVIRDLPTELKPFSDTSIKNWMPLPLEFVETDYGMKTVSVLDTGDPEVKFVNRGAGHADSLEVFRHPIRLPDFTDERQEGGGMIGSSTIALSSFATICSAKELSGNFRVRVTDRLERHGRKKSARQAKIFRLGRRACAGRPSVAGISRRHSRSPVRTSRHLRPRCHHDAENMAQGDGRRRQWQGPQGSRSDAKGNA